VATEHEGPSPDEVRRYVDSLYDRAESDTGTFNATRAAAIPRQRGTDPRGPSQQDTEPAITALARQWFDLARAKLGPTVPVAQPDRRVPPRPERTPRAARPARAVEPPVAPLALEAPKASGGVARELTGGTAQEPATGSLPRFPGQRVAPGAAGESRPDAGEWPTGTQSVPGGDTAAWPPHEPAPAFAPDAGAPSGAQSLMALTAAPDPAAGTGRSDLPSGGTETYGNTPVTGATAPYDTALPVQPTAAPFTGSPADVLTAPYDAVVPDRTGTALAAPAPAFVMPAQPAFAPGPVEPAFAPGPVEPAFAPGPVEQAFVPASVEQVYAPAPVDPAYAPSSVEPAFSPTPVEPAFSPTPVEPGYAPTPVEPAFAPAPVEPAFAPALAAAAATGGSRPSPDAGHRTQAERVLAFARAQIGRPCVWGAVGPGSYDAPGLTQAAWKAAGVTLPRTSRAQWEAGVQVPLADVQVGDLVFFHDDLGHVGIWSGDGMMIHAPGPGALIREESVFFAGQSAIQGAVRPA
jgi:cell wall-associated NlpC family hydrolase